MHTREGVAHLGWHLFQTAVTIFFEIILDGLVVEGKDGIVAIGS